jgi:hypothetical protein
VEIKVFDINEEVKAENLEQRSIDNIKKVFDKIFDSSNTDHLKIDCYANENSILQIFHENKREFDISLFAHELLKAEKKGDGTRNKQITEGNLFIKRENNRLFLLKLENIEVVDKNKFYEMRKTFSTENNYYKGCIFDGNLKNITIIDKNKSIAKFWRESFLDVTPIKNDFQNTTELISAIQTDKLFSSNVVEHVNYPKIKDRVENYIFDNESFDKVAFASVLRSEELTDLMDLNEIYSEESTNLDTEFQINKKALKDGYKKVIQVSSGTKIFTDNYSRLVKQQGIEFVDGKIILTVDDSLIEQLPKELRDGN